MTDGGISIKVLFSQVLIQRCWSKAFRSGTNSKRMFWRWNDGNFIHQNIAGSFFIFHACTVLF